MSVRQTEGGVTAAKGFLASGVRCGIRKNKSKKDLALIYSKAPCAAAAVYTSNRAQSGPIKVTRANLEDGRARAIICNSGIANTCAPGAVELAREMCRLAAGALGLGEDEVIVASTGVIGQPLNIEAIREGMAPLCAGLGRDSLPAAQAIMTTDTVPKQAAAVFEAGGVECRVGGVAKGVGMIHPNMATMLAFITTDCAISPEMLKKALSLDVQKSFNMLSVDGDTSTNDMAAALANGMAGNPEITGEGPDFEEFMLALNSVTVSLCRQLAGDGEGCTKLLDCVVTGAKTEQDAKKAAKAVICSNLTKAAMFGADANWGRVMCAAGYSGADFEPEKTDIAFSSPAGEITVCKMGEGLPFDEELAKRVLSEREINILVRMRQGTGEAEAWGCDLTYGYVKINGDYRT